MPVHSIKLYFITNLATVHSYVATLGVLYLLLLLFDSEKQRFELPYDVKKINKIYVAIPLYIRLLTIPTWVRLLNGFIGN